MDQADIAIATMSWARTDDEETRLSRALTRLCDLGVPVCLSDRGTSGRLTERLTRLPNLRMATPAAGLVTQVQSSIRLAGTLGCGWILYTEPDKEDFFDGGLGEFIANAPSSSDVGVVLASRTADSFQSFPPMQRETEEIINHLISDQIGVSGDYSYGPFLFSRTLLADVLSLPSHLGWGWRHATFLAAHRRGLRVLHAAGDFRCPPDQREESDADRRHRLIQLSQNVLGLAG
jgi:hypothetical protein